VVKKSFRRNCSGWEQADELKKKEIGNALAFHPDSPGGTGGSPLLSFGATPTLPLKNSPKNFVSKPVYWYVAQS
jgi:hypothetical protein